jgi:integrase
VKNGITIDTPIPRDFDKRIRSHWAVYRPNLRGSQSPWLFPSPTGKARSLDNVTKTLARIVARRLGVTFTPHLMRHILATQLYRRSPHNGVVVQRKLRHTDIKTTERLYGVMSNAGSNAAWQAELDQFRRAKISTKRRDQGDK